MNKSEYEYPTIEYGQAIDDGGAGAHPFTLSDKIQSLSEIFNKDQLERLQKSVGKSIYFTHVFTE